MYEYISNVDEKVVDHAEHSWEEWHGYLSSREGAPWYVDGNSRGICCHTCRTIIVEV